MLVKPFVEDPTSEGSGEPGPGRAFQHWTACKIASRTGLTYKVEAIKSIEKNKEKKSEMQSNY